MSFNLDLTFLKLNLDPLLRKSQQAKFTKDLLWKTPMYCVLEKYHKNCETALTPGASKVYTNYFFVLSI